MMLEHGMIDDILPPMDADGLPTRAKVLPGSTAAAPTMPLVIPWQLRGELGGLAIGTDVVFCVFDDCTGMILARADGEGGKIFPWDVEFKKEITAETGVIAGIRYETHTHTAPHGETSGPH